MLHLQHYIHIHHILNKNPNMVFSSFSPIVRAVGRPRKAISETIKRNLDFNGLNVCKHDL